jgi:hypothetical protein
VMKGSISIEGVGLVRKGEGGGGEGGGGEWGLRLGVFRELGGVVREGGGFGEVGLVSWEDGLRGNIGVGGKVSG